MFPGMHNQPNYILHQIKKKCFDKDRKITYESERTVGVDQLVFSIQPPQKQPKDRKKLLEKRTKQLIDSIKQFRDVAQWLLDTEDSDDLSSLDDEELKNQMKDRLSFLANAQATVDKMDKNEVVNALSCLNKVTTVIKEYNEES